MRPPREGSDETLSVAKAYAWVLAALLAAGPLAAQENNAVATASAPPPPSDIGPRELSNFSINGTVTRPAERPPTAQPVPTVARPEQSPPRTNDQRPAVPVASPVREAAPAATRRSADSDLFRRPPTLPDAVARSVAKTPTPAPDLAEPDPPPPLAADEFSVLPWLAGLLAIAGIAVVYFGRRRQPAAPAGHPPIDIVRKSAQPPARGSVAPAAARAAPPPPAATRRPLPTTLLPPAPSPAAPALPGAIVATGLRPWLEIELAPDRATLDDGGAAIAFEVTLFNSGSAAARDVWIEARLINAGVRQDAELSDFFAATGQSGDPIPQIAPFARVPLRSTVRLPRDEIRDYDYEGRKLFAPMVAVSVRYRWSSGEGHSAAGFLVGAEGQDKLAPLRLDRGARAWKGLGVRRYEKGLRS